MHRHTHPVGAVKPFDAKRRQRRTEIEVVGGGHPKSTGHSNRRIHRLDRTDFLVVVLRREFYEPRCPWSLLRVRHPAGMRVIVDQYLGARAVWLTAHQRELAQEGLTVIRYHLADFVSESKQLNNLRDQHFAVIGFKDERAHRFFADESQPVQRRHEPGIPPMLPTQPVHQEHAPAVRQGVAHKSGQSQLMRREVSIRRCCERHLEWRQIQAMLLRERGVFKQEVSAIVGQLAEFEALTPARVYHTQLLHSVAREARWRLMLAASMALMDLSFNAKIPSISSTRPKAMTTLTKLSSVARPLRSILRRARSEIPARPASSSC